jgi:SAM-dependent methyltransferase
MKWNPVTGWKEPKWDRRTKSWARKWNEPELKTFIKAFLSFHYPDDADRLYDVYYSQGPRYSFISADQKYGLTNRQICDVGCGCGVNLFHCTTDSYGIDINKEKVGWATALGLKAHTVNLGEDDISGLPKVEAIYCGGVIEHVDNLHRFLKALNQLLLPGGKLVLHASIIPPFRVLEKLPGLIGGYIRGWNFPTMHSNAFTADTLRYCIEVAGFDTIEINPLYPKPLSIFNKVPVLNAVMGKMTYYGQKNDARIANERW